MSALLFYIVNPLLNSVGVTLLKVGALKHKNNSVGMFLNPFVIGGYSLYFLSLICTIYAYRVIDFKNTTIVIGANYLCVTSFSLCLLREKTTKNKAVGILLIVAGIVIYYLE